MALTFGVSATCAEYLLGGRYSRTFLVLIYVPSGFTFGRGVWVLSRRKCSQTAEGPFKKERILRGRAEDGNRELGNGTG